MALFVVAFANDAPLNGVAVERAAGGEGLRIAPTGGAMIDDKVFAVGGAEAFAAKLTGVVSRADAEEANDDVMGSGYFEGCGVAFGFFDANAIAGGGLASDGD